MTDTLIFAAILIPILVVSIVFHEVAHGWVARALGDHTAARLGRLTLNPIKHVDPVGTLLVPGGLALMGGPPFGWAKPVPVIKQRLRNPRYGMMAVAAAGPATNIALAAVFAVVLGLVARGIVPPVGAATEWTLTGLQYAIFINLVLALFNLLPIPPFDGSHILEGLLPRSWAAGYEKLRPLGMIVIVLIIAATWAFPQWGLVERLILPPVEWLSQYFIDIARTIEAL
ncbi:site-2 protease family protein [Croceicoccus naphthovorans]|uniref:Peptidase M48 n=1 Tax=Croceicoccus naphthovorans TaxID=1348774 RepID=A0A0G3XE40_9SPHN|nr:site-2 protease family protein [Croceicoccus naphthovorans]AKM08874.1 peptidase M48 [Croceicoccus naphthovorans]MBB3989367.1 Zn-dependent protease [Croceicoccus naphthovorans]